jgi:hypothetical protein
MSVQECALYGDLVLYLRDQAAEMIAKTETGSDIGDIRQQLDALIRAWFFSPQDQLYGSAPRDVIWREQLNQGNPIPPEYARHTAGGDCDCPLCQQMIEEIEDAGPESHSGWHWTYCPESSLIDIYDPEGSDARWEQERLLYQPQLDAHASAEAIPTYIPPAVEDLELSPEEFMERLNRQPWVDQRLKKIATRLLDRLDCPASDGFFGPTYRRLAPAEATVLLKGLDEQGVDLDELVKQVEAWPYQNIALDWLSEPEKQAYFTIRAMETRLDPAGKAELIRFRQHRDLHFILCQLIPYNARLWLQGWLQGLALAEMAQEKDK